MSEKRIKDRDYKPINILSLHNDVYPLIFENMGMNDLSDLAISCKAFKSLVYTYLMNDKREDFWCFKCEKNLWFIHLFNPKDKLRIEYINRWYCQKCYNKLPSCDECFVKNSEENFVKIAICKNLTCFKKVCKGGCNFRCDNCSRIETDSSYMYQGVGAETFICGDCKDDFEERYGWYYPSAQKWCKHS